VSEVAKAIFKIIGALMLVYAALNLVLFNFWILVCIPCWPIFSALIILGIGMFYLRKWAAVGFSLLCCFIAFLLLSDPFPLAAKPPDWSSFIAGFLFMIPAVLTVTQWRVLVWRAK
jgi:hypothetical protein